MSCFFYWLQQTQYAERSQSHMCADPEPQNGPFTGSQLIATKRSLQKGRPTSEIQPLASNSAVSTTLGEHRHNNWLLDHLAQDMEVVGYDPCPFSKTLNRIRHFSGGLGVWDLVCQECRHSIPGLWTVLMPRGLRVQRRLMEIDRFFLGWHRWSVQDPCVWNFDGGVLDQTSARVRNGEGEERVLALARRQTNNVRFLLETSYLPSHNNQLVTSELGVSPLSAASRCLQSSAVLIRVNDNEVLHPRGGATPAWRRSPAEPRGTGNLRR